MNTPLTYTPAYIGLYISLLLAVTCNIFLDISYGHFNTEVTIWAIFFAITIWIGWKQHGRLTQRGRDFQKWFMIMALVVTLFIFLPIWRLPRGGIYMLAALQAAYNCGLTTRRQLYLGLLTATVMVMFAASHFRADWTMLFYLIPFVIAVVSTLVAEQINRRLESLNSHSLGHPLASGQSMAIAAASSVILVIAVLLYAVTPHISKSSLHWDYGTPSVALDKGQENLSIKQVVSGNKHSGSSGFSAQDMREAANRPGMPGWQSSMINGLAYALESTEKILVPIRNVLKEISKALKEKYQKHKTAILLALLLLVLLALLLAFWKLLREIKPILWLQTRLDYLRFGILARHEPSNIGIFQLYHAALRLFSWDEQPRQPHNNTQEYLTQLRAAYSDLRPQLLEMTLLFEKFRYGEEIAETHEVSRMRNLYLHLFKNID